jgi:hypothetical protein
MPRAGKVTSGRESSTNMGVWWENEFEFVQHRLFTFYRHTVFRTQTSRATPAQDGRQEVGGAVGCRTGPKTAH